MKKIVLSEKTLPHIIGRLNNFRGGMVKEERLRRDVTIKDAVNSDSYGSYIYGPTTVGVHPFWRNPSLGGKTGRRVMIYQQSHNIPMGIYHEGDIFYFVGNRMIIICVESYVQRRGHPKKLNFTRLTLLKSKKKLTPDERRNWEGKMEDQAAENRRYERRYWDDLREEQMEEMTGSLDE